MKFLNNNNFISPKPLENKKGEILNKFKKKKYILVNFLEGKPRINIRPYDCYLIGDLVRFTNTEENELVISGRIRQFLSLCGEHLSLENINEALLKTSLFFNVDFSEYTIYADIDRHCHCWYLGTNENVDDPNALMTFLDDALRSANDDYNSARKYSLKTPEIKIVSPAVFYSYMAKVKKLGSQNKMPRVLNLKQSKTWLDFINAF